MNETGAVLLEGVIRLDYQHRARCNDTGQFHKPTSYPGEDIYDYSICKYCLRPIHLMYAENFLDWITHIHIVQEWP